MASVAVAAFQRTDERGTLVEILNTGTWRAVLFGEMHPGAVMGNHFHRKTEVYLFLVRGQARVTAVNVETGERSESTLSAGEGVRLPVNESHAVRFLEAALFVMLKSQPFDSNDADIFPYPVDP
jgi:quercetin dioxygenase-like cupin family protein